MRQRLQRKKLILVTFSVSIARHISGRKRDDMKTFVITLVFLTMPFAAYANCKVSKAKYDRLQTGISYSSAVSILGCQGEEVARSEMAGYTTVMYNWYGSRLTGANMNVMFQNNKLVQKAQFGLK